MIERHVGRLSLSIVFLVAWGAGVPARAADGWPVKRGPSREPAPYNHEANRAKKPPKAFLDDYPACTIYSGINYLVEADGTVEKITHEVTRFSGRKAIERLGEYRNVTYDPSYETVTLNEARVFKADGRIVPIEPRHVQLRDLSTDYLVYDHDKQLIISFPSLEVGDATEVKWTIRGKNPEHQGGFFTRYTFGDDHYPILMEEMRVRLPKSTTLLHETTGGALVPAATEEADFRTFHWRSENRLPTPQDDNLPSKEELRLAVLCSTFSSWADVGIWKKKIRKDCWECTADLRAIVAQVTEGLEKPLDKARALTYWVRRHVRYVSVGEKHDYTPHKPSQVLGNRFGDCKDQSQLLAVMLREAGIPAALATLGTLDDGQVLEAVPSPWGTHAILLVTIDGKDHWIDTTVSLGSWDYLPRDDRDRLCYVLYDHDLRLIRTPPPTPEMNRSVLRTRVSVGVDGSSRCERHSEYHGAAAHLQRSEWVEIPPGERRRKMAADLQDAQSKARLVGLTVDDKKLSDFDQPVTADVVYQVPGHFSGESGVLEGSITDSRVWARILSINLDYDRKLPLDLGTPFESTHVYAIELSPVLRFDSASDEETKKSSGKDGAKLPRDKLVRSKWGEFKMTVRGNRATPHKLEVEFHTRLDHVRVEPEDFDAFRKFHEEVFKSYRVYLNLETYLDLKEVAAVEALLRETPADVGLATVLARRYHSADRAKDARRVVRQALQQHPKDLTLLQLQVQVAADGDEKEAAYAALIRSEPSESSHVIHLAEYRLARGDHAGVRAALAPILKSGTSKERGVAHLQLARCCLEQQQAAAALKELGLAAEADPASVTGVPVLLFKGRTYEKLGQAKLAMAQFEEVLVADAANAEALECLIRLAVAAGKSAEAVGYLRRYVVVIDDNLASLVKAADYYLKLQRDDEAFELASRARDVGFDPDAQRILGLIYHKRGDFKKALFHLDRATATAPVLEAMVDADLALGRLTEALGQVDRIDTIKTPDPSLRRTYALLLSLIQRRLALQKSVRITRGANEAYRTGIDQYVCAELAWTTGRPRDQVKSILDRAFAGGVEIGPAYALRGHLAVEAGLLSKALADAERALALSPKEPRALFVRGRVLLERGKDGALADLSRAAQLTERKDPAMLHWLALGLFRAGAVVEAVAAQREAAALKPNDEEVRQQLQEFLKAE